MKFVHIADVHLDVPFTTLEGRNLSERRRLEQREALKKVIEYIKENDKLKVILTNHWMNGPIKNYQRHLRNRVFFFQKHLLGNEENYFEIV